jgi:hypothetical protein
MNLSAGAADVGPLSRSGSPRRRVLVMGEGQLRGELQPRDFSEKKLLSLALSRQALQQGETKS